MSAPGLSTEAQLRYLLQWFAEFSELQREDFLPVLAAARGDKPDQLAETLAALTCQDKPVSLFQCRIKLFNEWYPTWSEEDQDRLVKEVSEIDPDFGTKLHEIMVNGGQLNGDLNGLDYFQAPEETEQEDTKENGDVTAEPEVAEDPTTEDDCQIEESAPQENIPVEIAAAS